MGVFKITAQLLCITLAVFGAPQREEQHRLVPMLSNRIVGGEDTDISRHPHQVAVLYLNSHYCGGSLLSDTWVITAAHCTESPGIHLYTIRAGTSLRARGGQVRSISRIVNHPEYHWYTLDYDISAVRLVSPFNPDPLIQRVALPQPFSPVVPGTEAVVTGWGALEEEGPSPDVLQEVRVPIISRLSCEFAYGTGDMGVTDRMICAGSPYGGRDSCQGDSGGPLMINNVLYGIVSWGNGCAQPGYPGVYASVPYLRNWIQLITGV